MLLSAFRQDGGDEFEVSENILKRIRELGINPETKTIVFSNALDFQKAKKTNDYFSESCNASFGIGTNLTCDIPDSNYRPANIVMKLTK